MSSPDFDPAAATGPVYFIVQRGRTYFENQDKLNLVRSRFAKVQEITVLGIPAAEVYVNQQNGSTK
jgi:hypothetical protein